MDFEDKEIAPEDLPFDLDEERWGIIKSACLEAPGVYYLSTESREYYAAIKGVAQKTLSSDALQYGMEAGEVFLIPIGEERSGWRVVQYELLRRSLALKEPTQGDSLLSMAAYSAEEYPEYFGAPVPPALTPRGAMTRYLKLDEGVFLVETDTLHIMLALSHPIWAVDLTDFVQNEGEQTNYDLKNGANETMGWLFFSRKLCAVPIYELLQQTGYNQLRKRVKSLPALASAIWKYWPQYAVHVNLREQLGLGRSNGLYQMLTALGLDTSDMEHATQDFVPIYPDQHDTDFLDLPDSWKEVRIWKCAWTL